MKKGTGILSVAILLFVAVMVFAYQANSGMVVFLKDGRIIQVPVNKEDILGISFEESASLPGSMTASSANMPVMDGLLMWLDASDITSMFQSHDGMEPLTAGNQFVGLWKDKSGNDNNFIQTKYDARPRFVKIGIGNRSSITFDTRQSMFVKTNFPVPVTVIYVARQTGGTNGRVLSAVANNWLLGYWMSAKNQAYYEGWVSPSGSPATDTMPNVFTGIVKGSGQNSEVWANGVMVAANQNGVTGPNGLAINTGAYPGEVSNCSVAEIIVFNRDLSSNERKRVEAYLKTKWGIKR